ncbi:hypothetical protein O9929_19180 [Vibrio lentus]|nr:hypothetical protein [Vibrio lentus]
MMRVCRSTILSCCMTLAETATRRAVALRLLAEVARPGRLLVSITRVIFGMTLISAVHTSRFAVQTLMRRFAIGQREWCNRL